MAKKEKFETQISAYISVSDKQKIQKYADEFCDSNTSQATRRLVLKGLSLVSQ